MGLAFIVERDVGHFTNLYPIGCEDRSPNELGRHLGGFQGDLPRQFRVANRSEDQSGHNKERLR
jgi:hypothetical protein